MAQSRGGRGVDISVRLPADLADMLRIESEVSFLTQAEVIRQALRPYLTSRRQQRDSEVAAARERAQALQEGPRAGDGQ